MKKTASLILCFSLLFAVTPAFSNTTSSSDDTHEIYELENTSTENISTIELMRWCNGLENNDSTQTENGVYEIHGNELLSINPNATYFLCTQNQIESGDLSPQYLSSCQEQRLYLVIKQETLAERPFNGPHSLQTTTSSSSDNQDPPLQQQDSEKQTLTLQQSTIGDTATRVVICIATRAIGVIAGASIAGVIANALKLSFATTTGIGIIVGCLLIGVAVGWYIGAYIGHYFFP